MIVNFNSSRCVSVSRDCNRVAHAIAASDDGYECVEGFEQILYSLPEHIIVVDELSLMGISSFFLFTK